MSFSIIESRRLQIPEDFLISVPCKSLKRLLPNWKRKGRLTHELFEFVKMVLFPLLPRSAVVKDESLDVLFSNEHSVIHYKVNKVSLLYGLNLYA